MVILVWLEVVKMAYLVGFIEVSIEVVFGIDLGEMSRKCSFYKEFVDRRDVLFLATGKMLYNVIYPPSTL